jgi:hypothetical protein
MDWCICDKQLNDRIVFLNMFYPNLLKIIFSLEIPADLRVSNSELFMHVGPLSPEFYHK